MWVTRGSFGLILPLSRKGWWAEGETRSTESVQVQEAHGVTLGCWMVLREGRERLTPNNLWDMFIYKDLYLSLYTVLSFLSHLFQIARMVKPQPSPPPIFHPIVELV